MTEAVENYLKAIHTLCCESPTGEAGMTRLAATVGVTTGTATAMVKKLAMGEFVRYKRFGGCRSHRKATARRWTSSAGIGLSRRFSWRR